MPTATSVTIGTIMVREMVTANATVSIRIRFIIEGGTLSHLIRKSRFSAEFQYAQFSLLHDIAKCGESLSHLAWIAN